MTLGEILPHNRSSVPMHIVLMFRDEDFKQIGQEKVLSSLVSDLKYLEDSVFQSDGTIYLFIFFNFSTNKYFCWTPSKLCDSSRIWFVTSYILLKFSLSVKCMNKMASYTTQKCNKGSNCHSEYFRSIRGCLWRNQIY